METGHHRSRMIESYSLASSPFRLSSVAELGATAHRQDAAGDKPGLGRKQKHRCVRNNIAVRAIAEKMNIIEVLPDAARILLISAPLFQHGRPNPGGADRIHPDLISRVVGSHRLCKRNHATLS